MVETNDSIKRSGNNMTISGCLTRQKALLLGGLYVSQMLGLGFIITALPAILRQSGVGLDKIGWIFALGFCWSLKFLWAPLIDRYGSKKHGHYRSWIIVLQVLMIGVTLLSSFFSLTNQLPALSVLFVALALLCATQDIAVDGLAVTILNAEERGVGNSIQTAGNLIGLMIGGGAVLVAYRWLGWQPCLWILAAGMTLPLLSIVFFQEKTAPADKRGQKVGYVDLYRFFRRSRVWHWIALLLVFRISNMIIYGLLNPLLVDLGWSLDRIGIAINIIGALFGIVGAVLGGVLIRRWGRKNAMLITMLFALFATVGLYVPARGVDNVAMIYVVIGLIMATYGCGSAVMYTVIMDKCDPASAATDFTLQMSISGLSAFAAIGIAMKFAESAGYGAVLYICTGFALAAMILIWRYNDFDTAPKRTS